jgi:hypothetical protein
VSVLGVAQSSSEIPEGLMNKPVLRVRPTEYAGHGFASSRSRATYRSLHYVSATGSFAHSAHGRKSAQMYTNDFHRCVHVKSGTVASITIRA